MLYIGLNGRPDTFAGFFLCPSKILVPLANELFAPLKKSRLKMDEEIIDYAADACKEKVSSHFDISLSAAKARLKAYLRHNL